MVDGLCGHSVGYEFIVDDRLFLVRRTVRLQTPFAAKIQEFRELVVTLNFCRALVNRMSQFLVPSPAQQAVAALVHSRTIIVGKRRYESRGGSRIVYHKL